MVELLSRAAPNLRRLAWSRNGGPRPAAVQMVAKALPQLQELSLSVAKGCLDNSRGPSLQHWIAAYGHLRHLRSVRVGSDILTAPDIAPDAANAFDRLPVSELSVSEDDKGSENRRNALVKLLADHCPELQEVLFCYDSGRSVLVNVQYVRLRRGAMGVHLD